MERVGCELVPLDELIAQLAAVPGIDDDLAEREAARQHMEQDGIARS